MAHKYDVISAVTVSNPRVCVVNRVHTAVTHDKAVSITGPPTENIRHLLYSVEMGYSYVRGIHSGGTRVLLNV